MALRRRLWSGLLVAALVLAGCATPGRPKGNPPITTNGVWLQLPEAPLSARREVAGGWLDQRFVLVGGWSDRPCPPSAGCVPPEKPALRDGASFDPSSGVWRRIADAPVPVNSWNTVVLDEKLYLRTGDISRADSPVSFPSYDPSRDAWETLQPPPGRDLELIAAGNQIVAISYSDERSPAVDSIFEPRSRTWRRLPRDPLGRSYGRSAIWLGDHLLLSAMNFGPNPEGGDEPMPDPQQRLRFAALSADFTRWTLLPDSDLKDCNLVAVAGRVVCPFHGLTGKEIPGVPGPHYPYGAVLDPSSGDWHMLRPPPASRGFPDGLLLNVGDRTFVGGHLIDPRTEKWTTVSTPWWSPQKARTVLASADVIFVWGGASDDANLADGYLLRL